MKGIDIVQYIDVASWLLNNSKKIHQSLKTMTSLAVLSECNRILNTINFNCFIYLFINLLINSCAISDVQ